VSGRITNPRVQVVVVAVDDEVAQERLQLVGSALAGAVIDGVGSFEAHGESAKLYRITSSFVVFDLIGELVDKLVAFEVGELLQLVRLDGDGRGLAVGDALLQLHDAVDERLRTGGQPGGRGYRSG